MTRSLQQRRNADFFCAFATSDRVVFSYIFVLFLIINNIRINVNMEM
jgi:hypothetical protein